MKKTEIQDPVNEALQHAGEPTVVTPELLALDQERVTSESEIPEEEFLFKLNGVPCCPRGDLSTMTGPAKTGKTNVAAMLMACCVNRRVLGFERISEEPLRAMWFDTEQSRCTTKRILTDRIGDLLDDINSGPASVELMQRLLTIASVNKCNITAMIHLNRSGEKLNLRGWIGTVMVQKSYEVFNCDRNPKTQTFSLGLTFSRRYYLEEPMYYVFDENSMPCVTDEPEDTREGRKDWSAGKDLTAFNKEFTDEHASDPYLPWDFRKLFDTAMGGAATLGYDELERRVMDLSGIRQKQYYYRVFDAAERQRVVRKVLDKGGRVAVIMLPC